MIIKAIYDLFFGRLIHSLFSYLNILIPEITPKEKKGDFDSLLNKGYPNALANLLLNQVKKIETINHKKEKVYEIYKNYIRKNNLNIHLTTNKPLLRFPSLVGNRNQVINRFARKNIQIGKWYEQVVAPKELDLDKVFYMKTSCPVAEEICNKIINLPLNVTPKNAEKIVGYLGEFIKQSL